uniref:Uncharacterized protein n=1 Tax=Rhizophora mucronata TaxID=61149 RepID=A0A2P2PN87_RHIMU
MKFMHNSLLGVNHLCLWQLLDRLLLLSLLVPYQKNGFLVGDLVG